jgi:hypothetical protein
MGLLFDGVVRAHWHRNGFLKVLTFEDEYNLYLCGEANWIIHVHFVSTNGINSNWVCGVPFLTIRLLDTFLYKSRQRIIQISLLYSSGLQTRRAHLQSNVFIKKKKKDEASPHLGVLETSRPKNFTERTNFLTSPYITTLHLFLLGIHMLALRMNYVCKSLIEFLLRHIRY